MRFLIIDDDMNTVELLASFLGTNGHEVLRTYNARDGLQFFTDKKPDAVFLDIVLPDSDGVETLKKIKTLDEKIPVIVVTGHRETEKVVQAFREGAFDCLLKPFNFDYIKDDILARLSLKNRVIF